jgi:hypothetical protein
VKLVSRINNQLGPNLLTLNGRQKALMHILQVEQNHAPVPSVPDGIEPLEQLEQVPQRQVPHIAHPIENTHGLTAHTEPTTCIE